MVLGWHLSDSSIWFGDALSWTRSDGGGKPLHPCSKETIYHVMVWQRVSPPQPTWEISAEYVAAAQLRLTLVVNPEDEAGICLRLIDYTLFQCSGWKWQMWAKREETRYFSSAVNANERQKWK